MANPHKGEVAFDVEGRSYTLRFSANAIVEMEGVLDKGVVEISTLLSDPGKLRMGNVRAVFWAGLTDHHEGVSLKDAGEIISQIGLPRAVELIGQGLTLAFPDAEGDAAANPPKPGQAGTGSAS